MIALLWWSVVVSFCHLLPLPHQPWQLRFSYFINAFCFQFSVSLRLFFTIIYDVYLSVSATYFTHTHTIVIRLVFWYMRVRLWVCTRSRELEWENPKKSRSSGKHVCRLSLMKCFLLSIVSSCWATTEWVHFSAFECFVFYFVSSHCSFAFPSFSSLRSCHLIFMLMFLLSGLKFVYIFFRFEFLCLFLI